MRSAGVSAPPQRTPPRSSQEPARRHGARERGGEREDPNPNPKLREGERERERERGREREGERECVCVCERGGEREREGHRPSRGVPAASGKAAVGRRQLLGAALSLPYGGARGR